MKNKLKNLFSLLTIIFVTICLLACNPNEKSVKVNLSLVSSEIIENKKEDDFLNQFSNKSNEVFDMTKQNEINLDRIKQINSYYDLNEPLNELDLQSKEILEGVDFSDNGFWIIFKKTKVFPELKISDFGFYNVESIEYYFDICPPKEADADYIEKYRQMAFIKLKESGKDKVVEAIEFFKQFEFLKNITPNYIFETHNPVTGGLELPKFPDKKN